MQQDSAKSGSDLARYMREHRYTQAYMAEEAKVNQATVSRFLEEAPATGDRRPPTVMQLCESVLSQVADMTGDQTVAQTST